MDIELARTFIEIARCGSFVAAAERLCVTQTAITARVQNLETQLNSKLFVRNRAGAKLTANGTAFIAYANQLVQTWEAAQRDLPLPEGYRELLHVGGEVSLSNPLLLQWVGRLREHFPQHAIRAEIAAAGQLLEQLDQGRLHAALLHSPAYWPGLQVEPLLEERLILVRAVNTPDPYVYIDWSEDFRRRHDAALPQHAGAALSFNLGPLALQYLLEHGGSGYFRSRVVQAYLERGLLERVAKAPEFSHPIYLVYARERDSQELQKACELLREEVSQERDWSQRWDPLI